MTKSFHMHVIAVAISTLSGSAFALETEPVARSNSDPQTKLELYREMSPVNYLSKASQPLLMIQGDKDTTIPVKHAYYMQQKADAIKAPVEIMIIRNAGHKWRKVDAEIDPPRETIIERTTQFFVDHL